MMMIMNRTLTAWMVCLLVSSLAYAQEDVVLDVMKKELDREHEAFKKADIPPYFISYRITDQENISISASFGSIIMSEDDHVRLLNVQVRIGDYVFDNTHPSDDDFGFGMMGGNGSSVPYEDKPEALQLSLWRSTQQAYKASLEAFKGLRSKQKSDEETAAPPDFSREQPSQSYEPALPSIRASFDKAAWEARLKKLSTPFLTHQEMVSGEVSLRIIKERKYFVSSEGSRIAQNLMHAYLFVSGSIRATDGDIVPLHKSYFAFTPEGLPADEVIAKDIELMITKLEKLRTAPLAEPYTGPAILHAQTAGVFFHEIFGHRVEGHRLRNEYDGQTFKAKIKEQVLPKTINVVFDPTLKSLDGTPLNGFYEFDDEGVRSRRVVVVEKGTLKTFLMSRSPLEEVPNSNGHARSADGAEAVSRQSNLIVESLKPVPFPDLRKMLIKECQRQGKTYGYLFQDVIGGFTTTDRFNPNAFNIFPTEVYRIYTDGRPDELVRGVDLIGTPLAMFAEIIATDNERAAFTGFCGAESGSVPVSAIAPSMFVRRIETQKKPKSSLERPLLNKPFQID